MEYPAVTLGTSSTAANGNTLLPTTVHWTSHKCLTTLLHSSGQRPLVILRACVAPHPILKVLPPHRMIPVHPEFPDDPDQLERIRMNGEGSGVEQNVVVRAKAEDVVWLVGAVVGPAERTDVGAF